MTCILMLLFMVSYAQDEVKLTSKEQRKAEKAKLKREKSEKENANWLIYQKIAQEREFVIEFERVTSIRTGHAYVITKRLNFLYAFGDSVIIQIETPQYFSMNGLGGITICGTMSNYKYKPPSNDKKPIFINFNVTHKTNPRPINISITVTKDGATSITFGTVSSIYGTYLPVEKSDINIGVDIFK